MLLNHCQNSLLLWYLRRYDLPTFGNANFLVERIIHSFLIAEKLQGNEQESLHKQYPLPVGQAFKVLHDRINFLLKNIENQKLINHFNLNLNSSWNGYSHNTVQNSVISWQVDDSFVDSHFVSVKSSSTVSAWRFSGCDF